MRRFLRAIGPPTAAYSYDGDGRRVKKVAGGVTTLYFYDNDGKLLEEYVPATGAGKDYIWMPGTYEPLARIDFSMSDSDNGNVLRVTKASPNVHLDWSLDGTSGPFVVKRSPSFAFSNPLYLGPGQTTKTYDDPVLGNTTNYAYEAFRRVLTDTLYFYHADHLGTPIAMTNGAGSLVWRAEHTPFGGIYALTVGTITNNLRFPGQYYDGETGLAQNWNRDYKYNTGRYWEVDPLHRVISSVPRNYRRGTTLYAGNSYGYSNGNPIIGRDPNGLCPKSLPGFGPCVLGCLHDTLRDHLKRLGCCLALAGLGGVGIGLTTCALIVAFEPELLPAYPQCALLASASTVRIGAGACLLNFEIGAAARVAGCIIGCGGSRRRP